MYKAAQANPLARSEVMALAGPEDVACIVDFLKDAEVVLLGEATHGTQEFYQVRANITRALIAQHGFSALAVEADWPDSYRASRYAAGRGSDQNAKQALIGFQRFPQWMWRNVVVTEFIEWLRCFNTKSKNLKSAVGFYGIDLYSLSASQEAVLCYLESVDPDYAARARLRYQCFDHGIIDPQRYGYETALGLRKNCEDEAVAQLIELIKHTHRWLDEADSGCNQAAFYAEQNARVVCNAEAYYRAMFRPGPASWNLRDLHMMETLERLREQMRISGQANAKVIVWAHNSHLGDARATEMGRQGQLNLGQLVKQRWGDRAKNVGFTTHSGTVIAASEWNGPWEVKNVRPSRPDSHERVLQEIGFDTFFLPLSSSEAVHTEFATERLERAIGVIYLPHSERASHYFYANLSAQFDAVIHFNRTTALKPLDSRKASDADASTHLDIETYPSGI